MAGNVDWGITGTLRMIKLLRETSRKIKISELKRKASEVEDECPRVGGGCGDRREGAGSEASAERRTVSQRQSCKGRAERRSGREPQGDGPRRGREAAGKEAGTRGEGAGHPRPRQMPGSSGSGGRMRVE